MSKYTMIIIVVFVLLSCHKSIEKDTSENNNNSDNAFIAQTPEVEQVSETSPLSDSQPQIEKEELSKTVLSEEFVIESEDTIDIFAVLNDNNVRLRDFPNLECEKVTLLESGEEVLVIGKTKEKQKIEEMNSCWYNVQSSENLVGWVYGHFLDFDSSNLEIRILNVEDDYTKTYPDIYAKDRVKFSINYNLNNIKAIERIKIPKIDSQIDFEIYNKLAGIYIMSKPVLPNRYKSFYQIDTIWGTDYKLGRGCYYIGFEDHKWFKGGDGEIEYFTIKSFTDDSVIFDFGENYTPREIECQLTEQQLVIDRSKYYKISGPTNYMEYLIDIVEYQKSEFAKYDLLDAERCEEIIRYKPFQIYKYLKNNEIENLILQVSEQYGLTIKYNPNQYIAPSDVIIENNTLLEAINAVANDLNNKYCRNFNESIPLYNEFVVTSVSEIQDEYPGSITVELFYDEDAYIVFIFIDEDNSWKLACIVNHSLYFV